MDSGSYSLPMQPKWNLRWQSEAFTRTTASGLRTPISVSKQFMETRKPERSKRLQAVLFLTRFGPNSLDFSTNPRARSNLAMLSNRGTGRDCRHVGQTKRAWLCRSHQSRYLNRNFGHDHSEREGDRAGKRL